MLEFAPQAFIIGFAGLLLAAAISDVRQYRIPNVISVAIIILYPLYVLSSIYLGPEGAEVRWLAATGIAAATFLILVVLFAFGVMGGGDVKLIAASSLWAGPEMIAPFIMITALAGGVVALVVLLISRFGVGRGRRPVAETTSESTSGVNHNVEGSMAGASERHAPPIPYGVAIACGGIFISGKHIINHFVQ